MVLGCLILVFGIYMVQAAVLHLLESARNPKRPWTASQFVNVAFTVVLLWFAFAVLS